MIHIPRRTCSYAAVVTVATLILAVAALWTGNAPPLRFGGHVQVADKRLAIVEGDPPEKGDRAMDHQPSDREPTIEIERNFFTILSALFAHNSLHGSLPRPTIVDRQGRALYSWRFAITEHMGKPAHPFCFDAPWNSESHVAWRKLRPKIFCFSGDAIASQDPSRQQETGILAITGLGTAFDHVKTCSLQDVDADTILIVESRNSGLHWMEPGDIDVRFVPSEVDRTRRTISGNTSLGYFVGFADGHIWLLNNSTPIEAIKKFFTLASAKVHDRNEVLGPFRIVYDKAKTAELERDADGIRHFYEATREGTKKRG